MTAARRALRQRAGWALLLVHGALLQALGATAAVEDPNGRFQASVPLTARIGNATVSAEFVMGSIGSVPYGTNVTGQPFIPGSDSCKSFDTSNMPANPIFIIDEAVGQCKPFVRALNAVEAGAIAVVIISRPGALGVASVDSTVNPVSGSYLQDRVRVPVGKVASQDSALIAALRDAGGSVPLSLSFSSAIPPAGTVEVQLWTDADDSCGYPCEKSNEFVADMAQVAVAGSSGGDALTITPHWFIQNKCNTPADPVACSQHCVGSSYNYCYYSFSSDNFKVRTPDTAIAEETIRRICLWRVLDAGSKSVFWKYVSAFMNSCSSYDGNYNEGCSVKMLDQAGGGSAKANWTACYSQMKTSNPISQVDAEIQAAANENVDRDLRGSVKINAEHFRGAPRARSVMQAACNALTTTSTLCQVQPAGLCTPQEEAQTCKSQSSVSAHMTKCFKPEGGSPTCECEEGYRLIDGKCVDFNECEDPDGDVCPYDGTRNVCTNSIGGYECFAYSNLCATSSNGGCWKSEDGKQSACKDNLNALRDAASSGNAVYADNVATCDCGAAGSGCYKTQYVNGAQQCQKVSCLNAGEIAGIVVAGVVILAAIAVAAVWFVRRRRSALPLSKGDIDAPGHRGPYSKFTDSEHGVPTGGAYVSPPPQPPLSSKPDSLPHTDSLKVALENVSLDR